jgi:hypothetical protein
MKRDEQQASEAAECLHASRIRGIVAGGGSLLIRHVR